MNLDLRLDWATTKAAQYACKNWHYTGKMPSAGVKIGVWEDNKFIGVILFGIGAANSTNGAKYGFSERNDIAELVRVALRKDHKHPVSKYVSIALRMLKKQSPNLRAVISFADPNQGHHGGIYQAGNLIYTGRSAGDRYFVVFGERKHAKTIHSNGWRKVESWLRENVDPNAKKVSLPGKHRYLMPLDDDAKTVIEAFRKPYPKRAKDQDSAHPAELGGETPTRTLQTQAV